MGYYNYNLVKDDLSLPAWLLIGATSQIIVSLTAPRAFIFVPAAIVFSVLAINFAVQALGITKNKYLRNTIPGRHTILFPNDDGTRPEKLGDKPIAMFLVGIRSNR